MYVKLFTSLYKGTLRGNSNGLLVFTNLLANADKDGFVDMHPKAISEEVGLTVDQVRAALLELEAPDIESRSPEEEGRRLVRMDEHRPWGWRVVNYVKYRSIKSEDDRREQNRLAQERFRNKHSKPPSASVITDQQPSAPSAHAEAEANTKTEARKTAPRKRALSLECPEDVGVQVWTDWLTLRNAKKAPVTATAVEGARGEALKAGMMLDAFLRIWCRRGTQGLEASWLTADERRHGAYGTVNKQEALEISNGLVGDRWEASMQERDNAAG